MSRRYPICLPSFLLLIGMLLFPTRGESVVLNEFLAINNAGLQDENLERQDWIELHNPGTQAVNLAGWHLTDSADNLDKWTFPAANLPANGYLLVFASDKDRTASGQPLHTNFKLSGEGEFLALVRPDGQTIEDAYAPAYPPQSADVSFGRTTNLAEGVGYFVAPTPRAANAAAALARVADVGFSVEHGSYTSAFTVVISCLTTGAQIHYTLEGSVPTSGSPLHAAPLPVSGTTILRARAFKAGHLASETATRTYLFLENVVRQSASPPGYPTTWAGYPADYGMEDNTNDLKLVAGSASFTLEQARERVRDSLTGLPSVSLVMSMADWFSSASGIYANPMSEGVAWERACSVELLPHGAERGFQANVGVEIHGSTARFPEITPKRGLQISFKNQFGPATLDYPVFTNLSVESFNTLILRSDVRDCWTSPGDYGDVSNPRSQSSYLRDPWMIESQRDLGALTPGRRFVHLYLNGLYWGVYNLMERPDNYYSAMRTGGDSANYDTVHNIHPPRAIEGDLVKWDALRALATAGFASNADYQYIQGNHPDGTRNPALEVLCDVQSLLGVLLPGQYSAPQDWPGNWFGNRLRGAASSGFQFSNWDGDLGFMPGRILNDSVTIVGNSNFNDTWGIVDKGCRLNAEYRLRYADFIQRHYFHGGALTAEAAAARWLRLAADLRPGMVAESARWGDYRRDVHRYSSPPYELYTPTQHWEPSVQALASDHVPARHAVLLQQYRSHGLYPAVPPPEFHVNGLPQHGGVFSSGAMLALVGSNAIYFTQDGTDPREYGTSAAVGTPYAGAIPLTIGVQIKARARLGNVWSALAEAVFVPALSPPIRLTELMVHPREAPGQTNWTASDFEFVELQNQGDVTVGLAGLRITAGVAFDFSGGAVRTLAPGQHVLVVANRSAFANRYPDVADEVVAGEFTRAYALARPVLRDEGETFTLTDGLGSNLVQCTYRDDRGWPVAAAGAGHSLVPLPVADPTRDLDYGAHWRASAWRDGSPGTTDPVLPAEIVLNEFGAHTTFTNGATWQDANDWIELFNRGTSTVTLADWYLSDRASDLKQWSIPSSNVLTPGGRLVFDEVTGFHPATNVGFGLSKAGDELFLSHLPGNGADRVVDAVRFKGQELDSAEGRWPDGGAWWQGLLAPTPGATNTSPHGRVVVNEFMPYPLSLVGGAGDARDEFVELRNTSMTTVTLANAAGPWRLTGEVEYRFSEAVQLSPGEHLVVVGFDPVAEPLEREAFRARYQLTEESLTNLVGPWQGRLSNEGGRLALERPQAGDALGEPNSWVLVDEVIYFTRAPWPAQVSGTGRSLQRIDVLHAGSAPDNWYAALVPSPAAAAAALTLVQPAPGEVCFAGELLHLLAIVDTARVRPPLSPVSFSEGVNILGVDDVPPYEATFVVPAAGDYSLLAFLEDADGVVASTPVTVHALRVGAISILQAHDTTVELAGAVVGEGAAEVTLFYGEVDGETNAGVWSNRLDFGTVSNGAFHASLSGLRAGTTYFVRTMGTHGAHAGWSPASTRFTTASLASWPWHLPMTFNGYTGSQALVNFPALIAFSTNVPGFRYEPFGDHWGSLRFQDAEGRALPYEVDSWNTGGFSHVWVRLSALTNGAAIGAYWGGGITTAPPNALDGSVWSGGYEAVWHLGESLADSAAHGHDAANAGSVIAAGRVGAARSFDGVDDSIRPPLDAAWYGQSVTGCTISIWANPSMVSNMTVFGTATNAAALRMAAREHPLRYWRYDVAGSINSPHNYTLGQWQMLSLVLSNGQAYAALNDGALKPLAAYAPFIPVGVPWIGAGSGGHDYFKGLIDEVRVSGRVHSADWLQAEFQTAARPDSFVTYGAVALQARADADSDGMPDAWERQVFGGIDMPAGQAGADWDGDGLFNVEEYEAGTDPTNATSVFVLRPSVSNGQLSVAFDGHAAQGPGYEGLSRYYRVLSTTSLPTFVDADWLPVATMTNAVERDGEQIYTPNGAPRLFFIGRVWLE